jgi:3-methyladenine DNA glycosylase AlkD
MLVLEKLAALQNPERAKLMARYFKTGKGQYAEGDTFWGLSNPQVRSVVKEFYKQVSIEEVTTLVEHSTHEVRACGLLMWVEQFKKGSTIQRSRIVELYLSHLDYINNWDLVDLTAHFILGPWLLDKDRDILYELAQRNHLWSQRVAIITALLLFAKGNLRMLLAYVKVF